MVWNIAVKAVGTARNVWNIVIPIVTPRNANAVVRAKGIAHAIIAVIPVWPPCNRRRGGRQGRDGRGGEERVFIMAFSLSTSGLL